MQHSFLDAAIWAASFLGDIFLLSVIFFHRYHRLFPIFTTLMIFNITREIFLFLIFTRCSHHTYFVFYWSAVIPDYLLQFGIVYEITRKVLFPSKNRLAGWPLGKLGLSLLLSIAVTTFIIHNVISTEQQWINNIVDTVDLTLSALRTFLFVSIIFFSRALHVSRESPVQKIITGLAIFSTMDLVTTYEYAIYHDKWMDYYQHAAYLVSLAYWITSLIVWPQFLVFLAALLLMAMGYCRRLRSKRLTSWEALAAAIRPNAAIHDALDYIRQDSSEEINYQPNWSGIRNLMDLYHNAGIYAKLADYASQHASGIPPSVIEALYTEAMQIRLLALSAILSRFTCRIVSCRLNSYRALELYEGMTQHITALFQENCPVLMPEWTEIQ